MSKLVDPAALEASIDLLELDNSQKQFIKDRWLSYVIHWDTRASVSKKKYYALKTIIVIGSVVTPALIGTAALPTSFNISKSATNPIQWIAFGLSLLVGICAALEELYRYGEIWREKRAAGEVLKSAGWRFFQIAGKYKGKNHKESFPDFAGEVEDTIEHEIKDYFLVNQKKQDEMIIPPSPIH